MRVLTRPLLGSLALVALAALVLSGCTKVVTAPAGAAANTVTAGGSGTVSAIPDQATMSFGVTKTNANAKTALSQVSTAAEKITSALEKAGIDKKDIQTQNVSVYPNYSNSGKPTITGYTASISVNAKVRDIGTLGDVINAANAAGADNVNGPTFALSEDSTARSQATEKAVADARKSAEAMAKAAGKRVGGVLSMSQVDVGSPVNPMPGAFGADKALSASVPISWPA